MHCVVRSDTISAVSPVP